VRPVHAFCGVVAAALLRVPFVDSLIRSGSNDLSR
jgi:hypothetical protein